MGTVDDIIKEFQNEITPWIPDIIKKSPEKSKEILAACKESAFLLYFLKTVPPKVLYYEDFIKYVRFDLGSNASLTIENQIEAVSRTLHSICAQINMNYPLMIYIKEALQYKTVDFSIESKTRRKELLYKTHAPFFLFYVLKYWDSLPVPGGIIEWNCLKHGLMPLYSCLNNYYNQAQTMNMLITQQIAEQTLGLEYFAFLLEKLDDLKEIVNCSTQALLNLLCMLRFLPSAKLSKMFCSYLIENFEKEEYRKNFSDNLIEFATQILKFLWHNNVSFETYINHAISISIEPNIPAGKRKIEEAPLGLSQSALHDVLQYFEDKLRLKSIKDEFAETLLIYEEKAHAKPDEMGERILSTYFNQVSPVNTISYYCQTYRCSCEEACRQCAYDILQLTNPKPLLWQ